MKNNKQRQPPPSWIGASSLGIELAVVFGFSVYFGNKADQKYGFEPLGVLAGVFFGFLYGSYSFWKLLKMNETKKSKDIKSHDKKSD